MDLPTYTNIWRIEKRLYKLYDLRLPMPLPLVQVGVFAGVFVPWIVLLRFIGVPFESPWHVLYLVPPGVLTWLATRPVIEGKRLTELLLSQARYLAEPRTWCRLTPIREPREVVVVARVWRRAAAPERAAGKRRRKARRAQPAVEQAPVPVPVPGPAVASAPQPLAEYAAQRRAAAPEAAYGSAGALPATSAEAGDSGHVRSGALAAGSPPAPAPRARTPWTDAAGPAPSTADTPARPAAQTTSAQSTAPAQAAASGTASPRARAAQDGAAPQAGVSGQGGGPRTSPWAQTAQADVAGAGAGEAARARAADAPAPSTAPASPQPQEGAHADENAALTASEAQAVDSAPAHSSAATGRPSRPGGSPADASTGGEGTVARAGSPARDGDAPQASDDGKAATPDPAAPRRTYVVGTENDVRVAGPETRSKRKDKPWRRTTRDIAHEDDMWVARPEAADGGVPSELERPPATPTLDAHPDGHDGGAGTPAGSGKRAFASGVRRPGEPAELWQAADRQARRQRPAQAPQPPTTRPDIPRPQARPDAARPVAPQQPAATRTDIPRVTRPTPAPRPGGPAQPPRREDGARQTRTDIPTVPGAFGGGAQSGPPRSPEPGRRQQQPAPQQPAQGVRPPAAKTPWAKGPSKPPRPAPTDALVWPPAPPEPRPGEPQAGAPRPGEGRTGAPRPQESAGAAPRTAPHEPPREVRSGPASPIRPGPPPAQPRVRPRPVPPPPEPPAHGPAITPPDPEQQQASPGGLRRLLQAVGGGHGEADAEYQARLQQPFQGTRHIVVLGCTGGAGQTVTALMLGHTFAQHNGEPVVAIDINPGPGALARRTRSETNETLTGLITRADQVTSLTAMRRYTSQAKSGLDVIAAGKNPLQALDDRDYALAIRTIDKFYSVTLLDAAAAVVARVLPYADQLVLVAPASADAPRAVAMTFEWLDGHGYAELRSRAVTVINGVSRRSMDDVEQAEAVARGRCRALVRIPWDDHLSMDRAPRNELRSLRAPTRRAYLALAGVVAGGFTVVPERYQEPQQEREAAR